MKIFLNGEHMETDAVTLADLLREAGYGTSVATAVNGEFVPATLRSTRALLARDRIEVVAPMQGG